MFTNAELPIMLETQIERTLHKLNELEVGSEEYVKTLDLLSRLYKMKAEEKPDRVSKDTMAIVVANILGILIIVRHEHLNVITSRAMNMVMKPK